MVSNSNKIFISRNALLSGIGGALAAICFLLFTPPFWLAEEPQIASHLAHGHGFLSPLDPSASAIPTAMDPPLYPYLMAGVYKLFGIETTASLHIMIGINVLSAALLAAGIYVLATRCFGRRAGALAVVLVMLNPVAGRAVTVLWHTCPQLALYIWIVIWCERFHTNRPASMVGMLLLGLSLGTLALVSPTVVLAYPVLVCLAIGKVSFEKWFRLSVACFAAFCVVLLPWTVRNYNTFGRLFFVRDNFALELWVGNQPGSTGTQNFKNHPSVDPGEKQNLLAAGEIPYFNDCWNRFARQYRQDPLSYWRLVLRRCAMLGVDPYEDKQFQQLRIAIDCLFAGAGLAGILLAWWLKAGRSWLFWVFALCSLPYVFTQINPSYTLPFRVGLVIYGGLALDQLLRCLFGMQRGTSISTAIPRRGTEVVS